jgi:hypothetical protein
MREAGLWLTRNPLDRKVGSFNSGIIGYYQGGEVVNLDGLANNDIFRYAAENQLPSYLAEKSIGYILDSADMFHDDGLRLRGGYNDPQFLSRLEPIIVFDDLPSGWKHFTLYGIRNLPG